MKEFNIYLTGVGGQGVGMASEILINLADIAGHRVKAVDTHGLAQRGGSVVSNIRLGDNIHSPLIKPGKADLVIALERHEAMRAGQTYLKNGGILVYYNAVWQPLKARLKKEPEIANDKILEICKSKNLFCFPVSRDDLPDSRMQNMAVLAEIARRNLIPEVEPSCYEQAMELVMKNELLEKNLVLFRKILSE